MNLVPFDTMLLSRYKHPIIYIVGIESHHTSTLICLQCIEWMFHNTKHGRIIPYTKHSAKLYLQGTKSIIHTLYDSNGIVKGVDDHLREIIWYEEKEKIPEFLIMDHCFSPLISRLPPCSMIISLDNNTIIDDRLPKPDFIFYFSLDQCLVTHNRENFTLLL